MRHSGQFAVLLMFVATASPGQQAPASQTGSKPGPIVVTGEQPRENKRVCQNIVSTGSIMMRSVCKTQAQWNEERERSLAEFQRMRDRQDLDRHIKAMRQAPE